MHRGSTRRASARAALAVSSSMTALIFAASLASAARAADADTTTPASAAAEGSQVQTLVVTAEAARVTSQAPTKGSLDETQPESIITSKFIQQLTPETGGWTTVVSIAPSIAGGISSNGGIGDYQTVTLRGFSDGEFNLTYDGIAFGDTNNPTHHSADYFPASTIGAVVVDRGPGAAGDLGQANFGGAIHFFSPDVTDTFGASQKVTYGSFQTWGVVTTINTGAVSQLGGAKLLLNFDERTSAGELSHAGGTQYNQLAKLVLPLGDKASLTVFASHEENHFNFEDSSGPGETWAQVVLLGKNFSMNNDPHSEHFTGFNFERKRTDFEYVDFKDQITPSFSLEDQGYTYWYSNKTWSSNDLTGFAGPDMNGLPAENGAAAVANTSTLTASGANKTDIGGYDKLNEYRVFGNIVRLTQDWSFGTLKVGGVVEGSRTFRHNCFVDESIGLLVPDNKFTPPKFPFTTNCKLLEESSWLQGQIFFDFYWRVTSQLTVTPGFKYTDLTRNVHADHENVGGGSKNQAIFATNNYQSPLYFITANYKVQPDWAVYAQFATSFLAPQLSELYVTGVSLQKLQSEYTTNYQLGTVYTHGNFTADADLYLIEATNLQVSCTVPDPTPANPANVDAAFCNAGKARFEGVEGETAYAFPFGLTLFANGAYNEATQLSNAANPGAGIAANPRQELAGAPLWTDAFGAIYDHDHWRGSLTFKQVGTSVQYNGPIVFRLPSYWSFDASAGYDFGRFAIKLQAFNLTDNRTIIAFSPGSNSVALMSVDGAPGTGFDGGIYAFQGGRRVELTLTGRF